MFTAPPDDGFRSVITVICGRVTLVPKETRFIKMSEWIPKVLNGNVSTTNTSKASFQDGGMQNMGPQLSKLLPKRISLISIQALSVRRTSSFATMIMVRHTRSARLLIALQFVRSSVSRIPTANRVDCFLRHGLRRGIWRNGTCGMGVADTGGYIPMNLLA